MADVKAGTPLRIYSHAVFGFTYGSESPGLQNCSQDSTLARSAPDTFVFMKGATFRESEQPSDDALSAVRFAKAYNSTIFRLREADVKKVCPDARLGRTYEYLVSDDGS